MTRTIYRFKADFFRALGHPARISVLDALGDGECSVEELLSRTGLATSHLSNQLSVLRRAGLVRAHQTPTGTAYSLGDPRVRELLSVADAILAGDEPGGRA